MVPYSLHLSIKVLRYTLHLSTPPTSGPTSGPQDLGHLGTKVQGHHDIRRAGILISEC